MKTERSDALSAQHGRGSREASRPQCELGGNRLSDEDDLHTYLNNHLAGGTGAIEMAEHCQQANEGQPLAEFLASLVVEIQRDHQTLQDLMGSLDATQNRVKQVLARMGEKASHPKLDGGDLGNLLTLESISLGIEGKACLWKSLKQVRDARAAFPSIDFDVLIKRAEDQRAALGASRPRCPDVARAA